MIAKSFDHLKKQLGGKIKKLREERGLSQEQLAEQIKYSRTQISYVEIGATAPSLRLLYEIAKALKVDVEELFTS